jgi:hypothetical protein
MSNEPTNLSRRALLAVSAAAAATTATLAGTAAAALPALIHAPDPAIVAVRECQAALDAYKAALDAEADENSTEDDDLLEERVHVTSRASLEAWYELFTVTPTSIAGAAALASYMVEYTVEEGGADTGEEALTALAAALQRFATAVGQEGRHA